MNVSREFLLTYFQEFLSQSRILARGSRGHIFVACSGGADSMLLLWLISELEFPHLRVLHVNYHSSEFSDQAQGLVEAFCKKKSIQFDCFHSDVSIENSNFERLARKDRYKWFHSLMQKDDLLLTGHNLTDSMEWSWMQMLKSSHPKNWLGIPVKNGRVRRPLMCLARHQIRNLVKHFQIPFLDDPSNENIHFERNRLRKTHLKLLRSDYPALEKNYVARHNQLAIQWGKHFTQAVRNKKVIRQNLYLGGVLLIINSDTISTFQEEIIRLIHAHSYSQRGSVRNQFNKLELAYKSQKEGPLLFSGGVRVFLFTRAILILSHSQFKIYQQWDHDFAKLLLASQSDHLIKNSQSFHYHFPSDFLCLYDSDLKGKDFAPRKNAVPLLPKTCKALNSLSIPWQTTFRHQLISNKRRKSVN